MSSRDKSADAILEMVEKLQKTSSEEEQSE